MIFSSTRIFCLWGLLFAVNLLYASPYNTKRVTNKKHVAASAADTLYIWTGAVNTDWNNEEVEEAASAKAYMLKKSILVLS